MKTPIIITNFKTYSSSLGKKAIELAKVHEKVSRETGVSFAVAVNACDISAVSREVSIPVFAQHIDPAGLGGFTGQMPPEAVQSAGAVGTLLNHSESRLRLDILEQAVILAKKNSLKICICANTPESGQAVSAFAPDFVAVEPPELIGGDISVTSADPEIITKSVEKITESQVLVGAGIKNGADVKKAIELGAAGVLLASGVTKAENPEEVLRDLASGVS